MKHFAEDLNASSLYVLSIFKFQPELISLIRLSEVNISVFPSHFLFVNLYQNVFRIVYQ